MRSSIYKQAVEVCVLLAKEGQTPSIALIKNRLNNQNTNAIAKAVKEWYELALVRFTMHEALFLQTERQAQQLETLLTANSALQQQLIERDTAIQNLESLISKMEDQHMHQITERLNTALLENQKLTAKLNKEIELLSIENRAYRNRLLIDKRV